MLQAVTLVSHLSLHIRELPTSQYTVEIQVYLFGAMSGQTNQIYVHINYVGEIHLTEDHRTCIV